MSFLLLLGPSKETSKRRYGGIVQKGTGTGPFLCDACRPKRDAAAATSEGPERHVENSPAAEDTTSDENAVGQFRLSTDLM